MNTKKHLLIFLWVLTIGLLTSCYNNPVGVSTPAPSASPSATTSTLLKKADVPEAYRYHQDTKTIYHIEADGKTLFELIKCSSECTVLDMNKAIEAQYKRQVDQKQAELDKLKGNSSTNGITTVGGTTNLGLVNEATSLTGSVKRTVTEGRYSIQVFDEAPNSSLKTKVENDTFTARSEFTQEGYVARIIKNGTELTEFTKVYPGKAFDFNLPSSESHKGDTWDIRLYWESPGSTVKTRQIRNIITVN